MPDKKQSISFNGRGGYIRKARLEEFLTQKFGRQIRVEASVYETCRVLILKISLGQIANDHYLIYVPEEVSEVSYSHA